jgi:cob(I)alamin adenosyltransferase
MVLSERTMRARLVDAADELESIRQNIRQGYGDQAVYLELAQVWIRKAAREIVADPPRRQLGFPQLSGSRP